MSATERCFVGGWLGAVESHTHTHTHTHSTRCKRIMCEMLRIAVEWAQNCAVAWFSVDGQLIVDVSKWYSNVFGTRNETYAPIQSKPTERRQWIYFRLYPQMNIEHGNVLQTASNDRTTQYSFGEELSPVGHEHMLTIISVRFAFVWTVFFSGKCGVIRFS